MWKSARERTQTHSDYPTMNKEAFMGGMIETSEGADICFFNIYICYTKIAVDITFLHMG